MIKKGSCLVQQVTYSSVGVKQGQYTTTQSWEEVLSGHIANRIKMYHVKYNATSTCARHMSEVTNTHKNAAQTDAALQVFYLPHMVTQCKGHKLSVCVFVCTYLDLAFVSWMHAYWVGLCSFQLYFKCVFRLCKHTHTHAFTESHKGKVTAVYYCVT